jgi:competence protein ComFC
MGNSRIMDASRTVHGPSINTLVWQGLNHLLWPAQCLNCGQRRSESDRWLCRTCWEDLLWCTAGTSCPRCGRDVSPYALVEGACPDCLGKEVLLDGMVRCGVYDKVLREMILAFKNGRTELDMVLASLAKSVFEASPFFEQIELLVPVPLHWTRRLSRGYNQATVIACGLHPPRAKVSKALARIRRTAAQTAMASPSARHRNVRGAFAVRRHVDVAGRSICLIDDIKTTGATLHECAKVLRMAGAREVFALILAVAGQMRN